MRGNNVSGATGVYNHMKADARMLERVDKFTSLVMRIDLEGRG